VAEFMKDGVSAIERIICPFEQNLRVVLPVQGQPGDGRRNTFRGGGNSDRVTECCCNRLVELRPRHSGLYASGFYCSVGDVHCEVFGT